MGSGLDKNVGKRTVGNSSEAEVFIKRIYAVAFNLVEICTGAWRSGSWSCNGLIDEIQPRAVMLENVRRFLDPEFDYYRDHTLKSIENHGYVTQIKLLNA